MPSIESGRVRMTLDLSPRMDAIVKELSEIRGCAKADIIRFAIDLLASAVAAKNSGMTVGAWEQSDDNRIEREFIGL